MDDKIVSLDDMSTIQLLKTINEEDQKVAYAVEKQLNSIAAAVDMIVDAFYTGGRLFYVGSGTSGKLGVIDASECPPTFGVEDEMVQGIISGGKDAIAGWLEHTEDNKELAIEDIKERGISSKDILVGITASGNTPYVVSAIEYGKSLGCKTIGLICRKEGKLNRLCDITIAVEVGDEVVSGSTRMKAGTAQKMVLNMLSTSSMIKLGNTYGSLMVGVRPINLKLQKRVEDIVQTATGADSDYIKEILSKCEHNAKTAIVAIKGKISIAEAEKALKLSKGRIAAALRSLEN